MIVHSNDTKHPIFTNYLKIDMSTFSLTPDLQLADKLLLNPAVAVFLLLSAVMHFSLATFGYKWYMAQFKKA